MHIRTQYYRLSKFLFIRFLLVFTFTSIFPTFTVNAASEDGGKIVFSENLDLRQIDETGIKSVLYRYFDSRYQSQSSMIKKDFSADIMDTSLEWVERENDKREIELYIASLFNLNYTSYRFEIYIEHINVYDGEVEIYLSESHEVVFAASAPIVSSLSGLRHTITLSNGRGRWLINKDEYDDELSRQLKFMTISEIKKIINENYSKELQLKKLSSLLGRKVHAAPVNNDLSLVNQPYSGTDAANYADNHTSNQPGSSTYNTDWYKTESNNDCANFVSQAIYAGEGKSPPDNSGMGTDYMTDWYYVFNYPMGNPNGSGSLAWINVQAQYDFITGNTNKIGPYGYLAMQGFSSYCDIGVGGVVQLYNVNGWNIWDHEGIVAKINDCWSMSQVLIDAHTTNRKQYPLSNWSNYTWRGIHISGWRSN